MEKGIVEFANLLRTLGIRVSTAEVIDAVGALQYINPLDRESCRIALQSMLVKEEDKIEAFQAAFRSFFVTPEEKEERKRELKEHKNQQEKRIAEAEEELMFRDFKLEISKEDKIFYSGLDDEKKEKLQQFLKKSSEAEHHVPEKFKSVLENLVKQHLSYWKRKQNYNPVPVEETGYQELDATLHWLNRLTAEDRKIMYGDMQSITEEELPAARRIIREMARALASKIARRYNRTKRKKKLDFRRTIRSNMCYGGVPLKLNYRSPRITKPQLVILADVSGSMKRYSSFVTSFVFNLANVCKNIQVFLFSEELEELYLPPYIKGDKEEAVFNLIENSKVWDGGTNLNIALKRLERDYSGALNKKTIFIIVSDTKTLAVEKAAGRLQRIRKKVKETIFLNTLPEEEWQERHSVEILKRNCRMYPCHTIMDLKNLVSVWDFI